MLLFAALLLWNYGENKGKYRSSDKFDNSSSVINLNFVKVLFLFFCFEFFVCFCFFTEAKKDNPIEILFFIIYKHE